MPGRVMEGGGVRTETNRPAYGGKSKLEKLQSDFKKSLAQGEEGKTTIKVMQAGSASSGLAELT